MMNKKIDIEKLGKRNPYIVPEGYFLALTHNIMDKVDYFRDLDALNIPWVESPFFYELLFSHN